MTLLGVRAEDVDSTVAPAARSGPLAGLRVLELGSFIAGPFAGQLLADYGAEVVKVESPDAGDPMRHWGLSVDGESLWWPTIARNKASVTIDLRTSEGRALVRRLASSCDVVLENFRPGRLDEWDLGYDVLAAENPGLVLVQISGFGQTGPRAHEAGFGSIGEAVGGIRHTTGSPLMAPSRCGVSLGDSLAALFGVIGTLAALQERAASGRGQKVDVAIYESVAALMESSLADFELGGVVRGRSGSVLPGVAPSNVYRAGDGTELLIAANADAVFGRLCTAMGQPELASDERFASHGARGDAMVELDAIVAEWVGHHAAADVLALLAAHGVPAGQIYTAADMATDPHYQARDMVLRRRSRSGHDVPMTGVVPKFSRTPGSVVDAGPRLGEHTREILRELAGVDDEAWDRLRQAGVV